mmetsp:Transcript_23011/g.46498  ORF Transcript_23011/g.46498 Transcript_23011/m.46498 type:complete len:324 (+) Transcript_23011:1018-1989(+)
MELVGSQGLEEGNLLRHHVDGGALLHRLDEVGLQRGHHLQKLAKLRPRQHEERGVLERRDGRGSLLRVHERHLPKGRPGPQAGELDGLAVGVDRRDHQLSFCEDVEGVALVALLEDLLSRLDDLELEHLRDDPKLLRRHGAHHGNVLERRNDHRLRRVIEPVGQPRKVLLLGVRRVGVLGELEQDDVAHGVDVDRGGHVVNETHFRKDVLLDELAEHAAVLLLVLRRDLDLALGDDVQTVAVVAALDDGNAPVGGVFDLVDPHHLEDARGLVGERRVRQVLEEGVATQKVAHGEVGADVLNVALGAAATHPREKPRRRPGGVR